MELTPFLTGSPLTTPNKPLSKIKIPLTKPLTTPPFPPPYFLWKQQFEVLRLLSLGFNITNIARQMKVSKPTILEKLKSLERKGLLKHEFHQWIATDLGKKTIEKGVESCKGGCKGGTSISYGKSIHANEFIVSIKGLPMGWENNSFMQCLKANDFFINKSTGQWMIYYNDCTIRISPGTKTMTFWLKECKGTSFEDTMNDMFDKFVEYFQLMENKGFSLDNTIKGSSNEFANKQGFFAMLSQYKTNKGFRIDTMSKSFWVDYSDGVNEPEEETNNIDTAKRMEALADSAMTSQGDFNDIDKLIIISGNLVKACTLHMTNHSGQEKPTNGIDRNIKPSYIG
jgi:hypothetical protein